MKHSANKKNVVCLSLIIASFATANVQGAWNDVDVKALPFVAVPGETVAGKAKSLLPPGKRWKLVWHDEFDQKEIDKTKWMCRESFWGADFPAFAHDFEGVEMTGETVKLNLFCKDGQYSSPHLQTGSLTYDIPKDSKGFWPFGKYRKPLFMHKYGYYEIRCRQPKHPGWHSAFWLQAPGIGSSPNPAECGVETDIMENYRQHKDGKIVGGNGWNGYGADSEWFGHFAWDYEEYEDGWCYYGVDWSPEGYAFYANGKKIGEQNSPVSHVEQFILVSTEPRGYRQVGNDGGLSEGRREWGSPDPDLKKIPMPDFFEVDFVRVYDAEPALVALAVDAAQTRQGEVMLDCKDPGGWRFDVTTTSPAADVEVVRIAAKSDVESPPPRFSVKWFVSQKDIHHVWSADSTHYGIPWGKPFRAELTSWMPLYSFLDANDRSRMTVACSESCRKTEFRAPISETKMGFECSFDFFTLPEAPMKEYAVEIRLDSRDVFYGDAIGDASDWMCRAAGIRPMETPESAFDPLYSTWYTFHQDVSDALVEEECALAAELGMRTLITDDGWQIDQPIGNRTEIGYMFCGDWKAGRNFPDMAAHVRRVHALGFKYMIWYSVPFVGEKSVNFARFRDKVFPSENCCYGGWVLDPRFPEVREFLIDTYEKAVRDWDLDGLKLDFIGRFTLKGEDPAIKDNYAGRDIKSIPLAAERLLTDVMARLKAIKPDILIEFRQPYIGPCIRRFGNMMRATDCPLSMVENRTRIARLRLTSGKTAVHADMLEWRADETPESAARCIINSLFGVVQYSVRLKTLPEPHRRMLAHWIRFSQDHREALLKGKFRPHYPAADYPLLEGESETERVFGVYQPDLVVKVGAPDRPVIVMNGAYTDSVVLDLSSVPAKAEAFDTFGSPVPVQPLKAGVNRIGLPPSGYLRVSW